MSKALATKPLRGYRASQNADGTWNIFDVPIYAANVRSFGMIPVLDEKTGEVKPEELVLKHDAKWLNDAIETAKVDFEERSYRAPLHIHHHGRGETVIEAGEIMPRYVRQTVYEGKPLDTLYADLLNVPDAIYSQIKARRLRYRSAEVPPSMEAKPEIKSLALLPHQPPHFKLPPLVVEEQPEANLAVAGLYSSGKSVHMLSLFEDETDKGAGKVKGENGNEDAGGESAMSEDDTKSKGGFMNKMLLLLTALCAKMGIDVGDSTSEMPKGPAEQPKGAEAGAPAVAFQGKVKPTAAAAVPVVQLPVASVDPAEFMALKAKCALYDERFATMDSESNAKGMVDKALVGLKGRNITEKMRADMLEAAKLGEKPLAMYVSVIEASIPKDPPADPLRAIAGGSRDAFPAEVLAYQAQGETALQKAVESWQIYKQLGARVSHVKLADFLKTNVAAESGLNFLSTAN